MPMNLIPEPPRVAFRDLAGEMLEPGRMRVTKEWLGSDATTLPSWITPSLGDGALAVKSMDVDIPGVSLTGVNSSSAISLTLPRVATTYLQAIALSIKGLRTPANNTGQVITLRLSTTATDADGMACTFYASNTSSRLWVRRGSAAGGSVEIVSTHRAGYNGAFKFINLGMLWNLETQMLYMLEDESVVGLVDVKKMKATTTGVPVNPPVIEPRVGVQFGSGTLAPVLISGVTLNTWYG